uniref:Uncharacterized protein n=1 Tax=Physcomitrium patens TaxID=3218 RepID=A0A2K1JG83_PHYPA|nr:hypothetical protein PHYPA_017963 [Physcomitrium patens]
MNCAYLRFVSGVARLLSTPFFHVPGMVARQLYVVCRRDLLQGNETAIAWKMSASLILFLPFPFLECPHLLESTLEIRLICMLIHSHNMDCMYFFCSARFHVHGTLSSLCIFSRALIRCLT